MNASPTSPTQTQSERAELEEVSSGRSRIVLRAVGFALLATLLTFVITSLADWLMLRQHESARLTIEISDGLAAVAIGALSFQIFRLQQQRQQRLRRRLELIADMNHHVRNALQVIAFSTEGKNEEEIATIRESVNRIQWALTELLPKL